MTTHAQPDALRITTKGKTYVAGGKITEIDRESGELLIEADSGEVYTIAPDRTYGAPHQGDRGFVYRYCGTAGKTPRPYLWLPEGFQKLAQLSQERAARPTPPPPTPAKNGGEEIRRYEQRDREITAIALLTEQLGPLSTDQRYRVLAFVCHRYLGLAIPLPREEAP